MAYTNEAHIKFSIASFVTIVLFIIGAVWGGAVAYSKIQSDIKNNTTLIIYNENGVVENKIELKVLDKEIDQVKINEAKIFTELSNITERQVRMLDILQNK